MKFPEGMGVFIILLEIMGGLVGGLFLSSENAHSGEVRVSCEIPSVVGVWIFSGTTRTHFH